MPTGASPKVRQPFLTDTCAIPAHKPNLTPWKNACSPRFSAAPATARVKFESANYNQNEERRQPRVRGMRQRYSTVRQRCSQRTSQRHSTMNHKKASIFFENRPKALKRAQRYSSCAPTTAIIICLDYSPRTSTPQTAPVVAHRVVASLRPSHRPPTAGLTARLLMHEPQKKRGRIALWPVSRPSHRPPTAGLPARLLMHAPQKKRGRIESYFARLLKSFPYINCPAAFEFDNRSSRRSREETKNSCIAHCTKDFRGSLKTAKWQVGKLTPRSRR